MPRMVIAFLALSVMPQLATADSNVGPFEFKFTSNFADTTIHRFVSPGTKIKAQVLTFFEKDTVGTVQQTDPNGRWIIERVSGGDWDPNWDPQQHASGGNTNGSQLPAYLGQVPADAQDNDTWIFVMKFGDSRQGGALHDPIAEPVAEEKRIRLVFHCSTACPDDIVVAVLMDVTNHDENQQWRDDLPTGVTAPRLKHSEGVWIALMEVQGNPPAGAENSWAGYTVTEIIGNPTFEADEFRIAPANGNVDITMTFRTKKDFTGNAADANTYWFQDLHRRIRKPQAHNGNAIMLADGVDTATAEWLETYRCTATQEYKFKIKRTYKLVTGDRVKIDVEKPKVP